MKYRLIILLSFFSITLAYSQNKPKFGICLSGGAALGYAHIGVLEALEENGIYPEIISGSSMGAIIGALYANGIKPKEMLDMIKAEKMYKTSNLLHFINAKNGLSSHKSLRKVLQKKISRNCFDSLKLPLYVCVSNMTNAKWKTICCGDKLHDYIIASASIPGIFEPIVIDDSIYVDGGLYNNLPAQVLKGKCDYIIGVDVLPFIEKKNVSSTSEVLMLSSRGLAHINSQAGRYLCNFLIEPTGIKTYDEMDFEHYLELYQNGYETTIEYLKKHPELKKLAANQDSPNKDKATKQSKLK